MVPILRIVGPDHRIRHLLSRLHVQPYRLDDPTSGEWCAHFEVVSRDDQPWSEMMAESIQFIARSRNGLAELTSDFSLVAYFDVPVAIENSKFSRIVEFPAGLLSVLGELRIVLTASVYKQEP